MPEEPEDVEAKPQQSTTPDTSQQKKKWRAIDWIAGITFVAEVVWGAIWLVTQVFHWCSWSPNEYVDAEHFPQFYCGVGLGILSVGYLTLILWPIVFNIFKQGKDSKQDNDPRWFHARILSSGIVGGSYAFLLPAVMNLEERGLNSGGAAALRQAILLATGGLIGLIALGETRRKNDNDREAAENLRIHQQDTLDQQKDQFEKQLEKQQEQFEANAFKDRKAERRERYTKAVEQLGDEKAPIRMGGVYTLVGLVDEWLEEESIRKYEDRLKEGQVIINNLCAYIRSPFTLATRYDELSKDNPISEGIYKDNQQKFYSDKAELKAEADVRLGIIKEIHDRLQGSGKNAPGAWSDFEYDFSGSTFFYPVNLTKSYYTKPVNFSGSIYQDEADFRGSTYEGDADFRGSTYQDWTDFSDSIYKEDVIFSTSDLRSTYEGKAYFSNSSYEGEAYFNSSTYKKDVIFSTFNPRSSYRGKADFRNGLYRNNVFFITFTPRSSYKFYADFRGSTYEGKADFSSSIYQDEANFSDSIYKEDVIFSTSDLRSTYGGDADFSSSTYGGDADFSSSTYGGDADFSSSIYAGEADFGGSTYQDETNFSGSIFYSGIYFGQDGDNGSFSRFTDCAPQFYDETNHKNTLFGSPNNDFTVDTDKGYPIILNSEDLPLGCEFLTSEQKEYLKDKFQEIEETKNKLLEVKDPEEKEELLKKLQALHEELNKWREEATIVKVEDVAAEDTES